MEHKNYFCIQSKIFQNVFCVAFMSVTLWIGFIFVERSDTEILERRNRHRFFFTPTFKQTIEFDKEDQRIATRFVTDTLPGLIQIGLIKKYERRKLGTLVTVSGTLWIKCSSFFKKSLLLEMYIYNKVNQYELTTYVKDNQSWELYAQITPTKMMEIYN